MVLMVVVRPHPYRLPNARSAGVLSAVPHGAVQFPDLNDHLHHEAQTMAKSSFSVKTVSSKEAHTTLRSLRSGRGGRTSKFQPVLNEVQATRKGQVVTVENVAKNQVQTLRSFVYRHLDPDEWTVKSARQKGSDSYTVVIGRGSDFE
jgi:hypothetical protein